MAKKSMKINMQAIKNVLVQKGEKIGLAIAAVGGLSLVVTGVWSAMTSSTPNRHADELKKMIAQKQGQMSAAAPPAGYDRPDASLLVRGKPSPVDGGMYPFYHLPIDARPAEDIRRRQPSILAPEEYQAIPLQVGLKGIQFDDSRSSVMTVSGTPKNAGEGSPERTSLPAESRSAVSAGLRPGAGARSGVAEAAPPARPEGGGLAGTTPQKSKDGSVYTFIRVDDLALMKQDISLVRVAMPKRMVLLAGSFPYKKQLEEFRVKLRYPTIEDLVNDRMTIANPTAAEAAVGQSERTFLPEFSELVVQRKVVGERDDWETLDLRDKMRSIYAECLREIEQEDDLVRSLFMPGLVMRLPKQFRSEKYPVVEAQLPKFKKVIDDLVKEEKSKLMLPVALTPKITDKSDINPFEDFTGVEKPIAGAAGERPPVGIPPVRPPVGVGQPAVALGATGAERQKLTIPEYRLIRFFDPEVEPGKTYEYRLQLVMTNPNYKHPNVAYKSLATDKTIKSEWFKLPMQVTIPRESHMYLVKDDRADRPGVQPNREQVTFQVHRWLMSFFPDPTNRQRSMEKKLGDWVVLDKISVNRCEAFPREKETPMPVWDFLENRFVFMKGPKSSDKDKEPKIRIPLSGSDDPKNDDLYVVDFEGIHKPAPVKSTARTPAPVEAVPLIESAAEVLLMGSDGKLFARQQEFDSIDEGRKQRVKKWEQLVSQAKSTDGKGSDDPFASKP